MTTITLPRATVERALEALTAHADLLGTIYLKLDAITALRAALAQEQDAELSAALGWPGGISDPVLYRTRLLQMVAALRLASQQALEALEYAQQDRECPSTTRQAITALRAALAQQAEPATLTHRHEWFSTGGMEPGQFRCIHCGAWAKEKSHE